MTPTETIAHLTAARDRINRGWTQGRMFDAPFRDGGPDIEHGNVCAIGGIVHALGITRYDLTDGTGWDYDQTAASELSGHVRRALGVDDLVVWNDARGRSKTEVVAAFDLAILNLEAEIAAEQPVEQPVERVLQPA